MTNSSTSGSHTAALPLASLHTLRTTIASDVLLLVEALFHLPDECRCWAVDCFKCWPIVQLREAIRDTVCRERAERIKASDGLSRLADALKTAFDHCEYRFGPESLVDDLGDARVQTTELAVAVHYAPDHPVPRSERATTARAALVLLEAAHRLSAACGCLIDDCEHCLLHDVRWAIGVIARDDDMTDTLAGSRTQFVHDVLDDVWASLSGQEPLSHVADLRRVRRELAAMLDSDAGVTRGQIGEVR